MRRDIRERATRGGDGSNQHKGANVVSRDISSTATLPDFGLTRDQSSRYQKLAAMPEEHFETAIATAKATVGEFSDLVTCSAYLTKGGVCFEAGRPSAFEARGRP